MKHYLVYFIFLFPLGMIAQPLNENPYLSFYLGPYLHESSLGGMFGRTYDGIVKEQIAKNIPATWATGFSLNHLPLSHRLTDGNSPFGRSYIGISTGRMNGTEFTVLGSSLGEMDYSLTANYHIKKKPKFKTAVLGNFNHSNTTFDHNKDGFMDLPKRQKGMFINSWNYKGKKLKSMFNIYGLWLDEQGGEMGFDKSEHYLGNVKYGLGTQLQHYGFYSRNSLSLKDANNIQKGNFFFDFEYRFTDMERYFGQRLYTGREQLANIYLGYTFKKGTDTWEFGIHQNYDKKQEDFQGENLVFSPRNTSTAYAKWGTSIGYRFKLDADIRAKYDWEENLEFQPNLQMKYMFNDYTVLTVFGGSGSRNVNVMGEYGDFLFSQRNFDISTSLNPEQSWYYGTSVRYNQRSTFELGYTGWYMGNFRYYALFYHNIYENYIYADLSDPNLISLNNHTGKTFKTSLNNRVSFQLFQGGIISLMHRFDVFRSKDINDGNQRQYYPMNSLLITFDYRFRNYFSFNSQYHFVSGVSSPSLAYANGISPKRSRWDFAFNVPLGQYLPRKNKLHIKNLDAIIGFDNVTGNNQRDFIINPSNNPFASDFDGGIRVGNAVGMRFYGGLSIGL